MTLKQFVAGVLKTVNKPTHFKCLLSFPQLWLCFAADWPHFLLGYGLIERVLLVDCQDIIGSFFGWGVGGVEAPNPGIYDITSHPLYPTPKYPSSNSWKP